MNCWNALGAFTCPESERARSCEFVLVIQFEPLTAATIRNTLKVVFVNHVRVHDSVFTDGRQHVAVSLLQNECRSRSAKSGGHDSNRDEAVVVGCGRQDQFRFRRCDECGPLRDLIQKAD